MTKLIPFRSASGAALLLLVSSASPCQTMSEELPLMPWPSSVHVQEGSVPIDARFSVSISGVGASDPRVQFAAGSLPARVARQTGLPVLAAPGTHVENATVQITVGAADHASPQRLGDNENYSLTIANHRVLLAAEQPLGVVRGVETFLQLITQDKATARSGDGGFSVPALTISDQPRFPWRGLSLDVSRHFIPVDGVKRTIDGLAAVKLNVLHWHLSDDQGFRVESKTHPKLQELGSDGLFYTQDEIRDVVAYASLRGVRIVPEFDMPGHSTSWFPGYADLASVPQQYQIVRDQGVRTAVMDPTKDYTYEFLDSFIAEMAALFPDEYFHIGGDEVDPKQWKKSASIQAFMAEHKLGNAAALQAYFNQRLLKIVTSHGKRMEGWDEILHPDLPKTIVIQSWRGQDSLWTAAREGYAGILSAGYYLDLMYSAADHYAVDPMKVPPGHKQKSPSDPVPGSSANLTPEQAKLILGGEAAMWEEIATAENLDAKLWPRLAAIAERFWSPENMTDVDFMYRRLAVTNRWLEWLGLTQRSNLELMRKRLAGDMPVDSLDTFSSVLEPVKGYVRHQRKFTSLSPFNRLIDAIPPESEPARRFRVAVSAFLAGGKSARDSEDLRRSLTEWADASRQVRPVLQANSLLVENMALADAVHSLCETGLEALSFLDGTKAAPADWKAAHLAMPSKFNNKPLGDFLIQIAPGVDKLVSAVGK